MAGRAGAQNPIFECAREAQANPPAISELDIRRPRPCSPLARRSNSIHAATPLMSAKVASQISDLREIHCKKENEGHVELTHSTDNASCSYQEALIVHRTGICNCSRVAGNEHKHFRGVTKAVIAYREAVKDIGRDVVDKYEPQRQPPEEIQSEVSLS
jgi:hypothetical protein